jgi:hypothetical protein
MRRVILLVLVLISVTGAQSRQTGQDPEHRVVVYLVDGSVHEAALTYRDADGVTRQKDVFLPYKEQFFAPYGAFVYLSAQKQTYAGMLRVVVLVGGVPFRESNTEEAFGIATASGKVAQY